MQAPVMAKSIPWAWPLETFFGGWRFWEKFPTNVSGTILIKIAFFLGGDSIPELLISEVILAH